MPPPVLQEKRRDWARFRFRGSHPPPHPRDWEGGGFPARLGCSSAWLGVGGERLGVVGWAELVSSRLESKAPFTEKAPEGFARTLRERSKTLRPRRPNASGVEQTLLYSCPNAAPTSTKRQFYGRSERLKTAPRTTAKRLRTRGAQPRTTAA